MRRAIADERVADRADAALKLIRGANHPAWIIGEIARGTGLTKMV